MDRLKSSDRPTIVIQVGSSGGLRISH